MTIDLKPIYGALTSRQKGLNHLVQEVEKLRKAAEKVAQEVGTVEVYDGPTRDAERAERRAERQRSIRRYEEQRGLPHPVPDPDANDDGLAESGEADSQRPAASGSDD